MWDVLLVESERRQTAARYSRIPVLDFMSDWRMYGALSEGKRKKTGTTVVSQNRNNVFILKFSPTGNCTDYSQAPDGITAAASLTARRRSKLEELHHSPYELGQPKSR